MNPPLRYIPLAEYVVGCSYYHTNNVPPRVAVIKADSLGEAISKGRELLKPSHLEYIHNIETRPNPNYTNNTN